jgi:Zn-dependent protease
MCNRADAFGGVSWMHGKLDQALSHLWHRHRHPLELGVHLRDRHVDVRYRLPRRNYPEWTDPQRWVAGALIAGVFFLSILAHELSHAVVSNRNGLPVKTITLFVFGGVSNLSREAR